MKFNLDWSNAGITRFWTMYGNLTVLIVGALLTAAVIYTARRIVKTPNKGRLVSVLTPLVVMAWTAEGMVWTAVVHWHVPWEFATIAFFVFEAMMLDTAITATQNRRERGIPGAAGLFAFCIAATQGVVASFGADTLGEKFFRFILPPLATGLWYVRLVRPSTDDTPEIKEARAQRARDREATWVWTPTTILMKFNIKRAGKIDLTGAQRAAQIDTMVELADTIALLNQTKDLGLFAKRKLNKARRKLREKTRAADAGMVTTVAEHVDRAARAEALMVPGAGEPPINRWASDLNRRQRAQMPPNPGDRELDQADTDDDEAPVSGAPAGSRGEAVPRLVDATWWTSHQARIELVMREYPDTWWNGPKALSVDLIQALGKTLTGRSVENEGLSNRTNAGQTAACLRLARYARLAPEHFKTLQAQNPGLEIPTFVTAR